jgi:hypothetical protein
VCRSDLDTAHIINMTLNKEHQLNIQNVLANDSRLPTTTKRPHRRGETDIALPLIRALPLDLLLHFYCRSARLDTAYKAIDCRSQRWYVRADAGHLIELIFTGSKWYDVRRNKGGGGAIDLYMHLLGSTFQDAVAELRPHARPHSVQ